MQFPIAVAALRGTSLHAYVDSLQNAARRQLFPYDCGHDDKR
jgi:hypothetical protein